MRLPIRRLLFPFAQSAAFPRKRITFPFLSVCRLHHCCIRLRSTAPLNSTSFRIPIHSALRSKNPVEPGRESHQAAAPKRLQWSSALTIALLRRSRWLLAANNTLESPGATGMASTSSVVVDPQIGITFSENFAADVLFETYESPPPTSIANVTRRDRSVKATGHSLATWMIACALAKICNQMRLRSAQRAEATKSSPISRALRRYARRHP
jgi:hypothetical protein